MSFEVYVGNYPTTFTSDDLLNLFQDFEGIELLRSKKVNNKCFSFFRCVDESQVVDLVTAMHDIDVCGRNLIVRATNKDLQLLIVESLQENNVLDKHPRNTHHSHLGGVEQSSNGINVMKNFKQEYTDEVASDFPIGVRFINPRLQSSHIEKEYDSVDQQRSSSRSNEYHLPTQLECVKESNPPQQNLPIKGIGVSKYNDSGQNLSLDSNKHGTKAQNHPDEKASFSQRRQFEDLNPSRPNFVDPTTQGNTRFTNPRFRSPLLGKNTDYVDHQNRGSQLSATHVKTIQEVFENEKKSCQSSSSSHGTGVPKHNDSYQNSTHVSIKPDTMTQHFPDGGASIQKYEQQHYESSKPGIQSFANRANESNSDKSNSANGSSNSGKQNFANHSNESSNFGKQYFSNCANESSSSGKQNFAYHANKSSNSGKQNCANESSNSGKQYFADRANESSNSSKQKFANESGNSGKQKFANESSNPGKQNFVNHATKSHSYGAKGGNLSHSGSCSTSSNYQRDSHYNILNEDIDIEGAYHSEPLDDPECQKDLFYVSVVNFPFHTSIEDIFYLFQDFDPYNIIMICNFPAMDRRPTEAIICFQSPDQATDAIMNFDNTFYCGRSLVVTDATDLTMVPALLSMTSKDI